jgi:predicted dehydrogenase
MFQKDLSCRITAICDVDQERLKETFGSLAAGADTYQDFRRLLDRRDIDAVIVATPDHWHAIPALRAIRSGKDVYREKPIGHTVEEGAALVAEAERSNRIVEVGLQQRSGTLFTEAARVIRQGGLGKISLNTWNQSESGGLHDLPAGVDYDFWFGPAPKRRFNPNRFH